MRSSSAFVSILVLCGAVCAAAQQAAAPTTPVASAAQSTSAPTLIRLDGRLQTSAGGPRTGTVVMVVSLYAAQDDTTPLWTEQQSIALDAAGRYTVWAGASLADGLPQD